MIPEILGRSPDAPHSDETMHHVLVVIGDLHCRNAVTRQLSAVGFQVTSAGIYGVVELLDHHDRAFDLLITAQSPTEMSVFGLPQLARSTAPSLPILVLDCEATCGAGVLDAVHHAIGRWPRRGRPNRSVH